jgi:hypothetical protein
MNRHVSFSAEVSQSAVCWPTLALRSASILYLSPLLQVHVEAGYRVYCTRKLKVSWRDQIRYNGARLWAGLRNSGAMARVE